MADYLQAAQQEYFRIFDAGGEGLLHALFPNNFELYFFAFELEDELKVTDRFIFPISPTSLTINEPKISTVIKTSGGVINLFNTSYNPMMITLSGDFGRDFKLLVANKSNLDGVKNSKTRFRENWVDQYKNVAEFINPFIKTGFGAFNELKRIIRKSTQLTATGKPYRLIFYNLAFSEIYLCQVLEFNPSMNVDKNMIHQFSLTMKAISYYNTIEIAVDKVTGFKDAFESTRNTIKSILN